MNKEETIENIKSILDKYIVKERHRTYKVNEVDFNKIISQDFRNKFFNIHTVEEYGDGIKYKTYIISDKLTYSILFKRTLRLRTPPELL